MLGGYDRRTILAGLMLGTLGLSAKGVAVTAATPAKAGPGLPSGVRVSAAGSADMVFLSGAAALDLYHLHPHIAVEEILPDDIAAQTHMTLRNLREVLRVKGLDWSHVVSVMRYQRDIGHSAEIERVMALHFGDWRPATSAVAVRKLSAPSSLLELEIIAIAPKAASQRTAAMPDIEVIHSRPAIAESMIFAPGIRVDAGTDLVFLSGITAAPFGDGAADQALPDDFDEQVRMATGNIDAVLADIGADKSRIVRIVTFYTEDFSGREMGRYLGGWKPCSSAIGVSALPVKGAKVMYDIIIAAPTGR